MHVVQVRVAALCEGAQQVECPSALRSRFEQPFGIGRARFHGELAAVDIVAAIGGKRDAVARFQIVGSRLGELAGDASDLHDRYACGKRQHHRHLQQDAKHVADIVGMELGEAFRAVSALKQKCLALGHLGEARHQASRLASEHQRGMCPQFGLDGRQRSRIRVDRSLPDRLGTPALRGPGLGHADLHHSAVDIWEGGRHCQPVRFRALRREAFWGASAAPLLVGRLRCPELLPDRAQRPEQKGEQRKSHRDRTG